LGLARKLGILAAAIFIALILWLYVHLAGTYEVDLDIPLEISSPQGFALAKELPQRVHTKLRGPGWRLLLMDFTSKTKFSVDLTTRDPNTFINSRFFITGNDLSNSPSLPSEVQLLKIVPDSLELVFSREITKRVPIDLRLDVECASGFTLVGDPLMAPIYVTVKGSNTILDSLRFFPTKALKLRGLREGVTKQVELSDTLTDAITSKSVGLVTIKLGVEALGEREFKDIPVTVEALPPDREMLLIPSSVSVMLRGGVDELSKLDPQKIHASVIYDMATFDTLTSVKPTVELPKGMEFLSSEPVQVKFVIRKR
jgi:YbbR domain-containing protein